MTNESFVEVLQAAEAGKVIECRFIREGANGAWVEKTHRHWDTFDFDYRVKFEPPAPREWQAAVLTNGVIVSAGAGLPSLSRTEGVSEFVRVREVLE